MISPEIDHQRWKRPLWVVFPSVSPQMYPRPAAWNAYAAEWQAWYFSLSSEERQAYKRHFPEPDSWRCFYRFISNEP